MKRPLVLYAAPAMLLWKSATLTYGPLALPEVLPRNLVQPAAFLALALWLYWQPRWARWLAGAFFAYAAIHGALALGRLDGPVAVIVRRPFSVGIAAWFACSLLFGKRVKAFVNPSGAAILSPNG